MTKFIKKLEKNMSDQERINRFNEAMSAKKVGLNKEEREAYLRAWENMDLKPWGKY